MAELTPYTGPWGSREAAHLLARSGFGASQQEIADATERGLDATVARLLEPQPESDSFQKTQRLLRKAALAADNIDGLKGWWLYRMIHSHNPLAEKMALVWHNHFATSWVKVKSTAAMAAQNDLIRQHALGSFSDLVQGMIRDVAMLEWLDGNSNRKRQPNENFARELMELFTLGEGNYTEGDIREAARAFTGWHVRRGEFWMNRGQHDSGSKTLFGSSGDYSGDRVADLCLQHDACPPFIASKLLRAFVTATPGAEMIATVGERLRAHEFDVGTTLGELLRSELFFAPQHRRSMIKSPVDLVAGSGRMLGLRAKLDTCTQLMAELGQNLFEPPTVKGWEGGRLWINSATMLQRANFAAGIAEGKRFGRITVTLPAEPGALAELLLNSDLPTSVATTASKQSGSATLQLLMSLPEFQLI